MHVENTGSDEDDGKEFDRGKFFPKEKYGEEHTENDGCFTQGRDHLLLLDLAGIKVYHRLAGGDVHLGSALPTRKD